MPNFPTRYESQQQLTTQAPSAPISKDTSGEITEAKAQVGTAVQENSVKWSQAHDVIQKTVATANFKTGMADVIARASVDPGYNNSDQYFKEIEKLKTDNLKGFTSKVSESEMMANFGYESSVGKIQIQNLYRKKEIDLGQTAALQLIDKEINSPNKNSLGNIQALLNAQVSVGILDHKDAFQLLQKANQDLGVNQISKDLYLAQTPEQVDAISQAITSGAYEEGGVTIDPEKKKSLLEVADRVKTNTEKKLKAQAVEAETRNRMETITGLASGKIDFNNLDLTAISAQDPQLADTLSKVKDFMVNYNPKLSPKEQAMSQSGLTSEQEIKKMKNYARSITDIFLHKDNKELSDFVLRELEKKGDGLTASVKIAAFANLAALKANVNNPQNQQDTEVAERFHAIKAGIAFLQASNSYLAPQAIGDFVVKNFLSGAKGQDQIMQEAKAVLRDKIIDRHKAVTKLDSLPNKIVDGEASVEDLQAGLNELKGEKYSATNNSGKSSGAGANKKPGSKSSK